jgi:OmpA-OmpF porin, OOP family
LCIAARDAVSFQRADPVKERDPMRKVLPMLVVLLAASAAHASPPPLPTSDKEGSADNPLFERFDGSVILSYEHKHLDEFRLPLSKLERVPDKKDTHNNNYFEPSKAKPLEGAYTHIVYVIPSDRSPLEVVRHYQDQVKAKRGTVLYECKAQECGGDPTGNITGGGGNMSLSQYLYAADRMTDPTWTIGWCASHAGVADMRYMAAELPAQGAHLSVLTMILPSPNGDCAPLRGRTIVRVDVVEAKARETKKPARAKSR